MDTTLVLDATRALHLVGVAIGLGLALLADLTAVRCLRRPIDDDMLTLLRRLHTLIFVGLGLLWYSGLSLAWLKTGFAADAITAKLAIKLVIVCVLTANAMVMEDLALPLLERNRGNAFGQIALRERLTLGAAGGLSMACWVSALSLGVFTAFRDADMATIAMVLGPVLAGGLLGGMALAAWVAPRMAGPATPVAQAQAGTFVFRR